MRRPSRAGLPLVLAFCAGIPLAAQNLESLGREKPFSLSGALSFNQIVYSARGIALRRDPYSFIASGNLNLSVYGLNLPVSFCISGKRTSFTQPFNQYSMHPTWKWLTAHAGYTSMSLSPYTVNGHVFLGGGVDIAPKGNWKISALYGRFLKATEHDTAQRGTGSPAYQRMGYAMKATYGSARNFVDLILFHAADEVSSIGMIPDSLSITPQENLVVGIAGGRTMAKYFVLKAELATSAITRDKRAETVRHRHPLASVGLFESRLSSSYHEAFKTSLDYQKEAWMLGFAYERVDPGYRTLGAYYFNNDLENVTVNGSAGLLKGKLSVVASAGVQHDNLDKTKVSNMRRMAGSMNMNYTPSKKINISASYSSFQTYTNIRSKFERINQLTPFDNFDTLNFTQISRNASLSGIYSFVPTGRKRQRINVQLTWQDAADIQGEVEQHTGTRFYNISAGYSMNIVPANMNMTVTFNTTINESPSIQSRMTGPTASVSRSFFQRKVKTTLSSSYNQTYSNGVNINSVFNNRLNAVFSLAQKHNLSVSVIMVRRVAKRELAQRSFTEFTGTLGYSYAFGGGR
jgi:hypothetical protein